jgi:serine/threonine-protein kinase
LDGKYRVLAQLGHGGTADVFLGVPRTSRAQEDLVVLKALRSDLRFEREFTEMFLNEAGLAARLNHPNIVKTGDVFEFDGLPVIVMEYLAGRPLSQATTRPSPDHALPLVLHLYVLTQALAGLHYSHELTDFDGTRLQVVHRDVSPHNVFITYDGQVKVLDFGIAKLANSQVETATGIIKGKLRYMAPEQLAGEPVDRRADVFSVGVMLWEAIAGQKMWAGVSELQVMRAISEGAIPSLGVLVPDVDPKLDAVVARALAKKPADRFATADEMRQALLAALEQSGTPFGPAELERWMRETFGSEQAEVDRVIHQRLAQTNLSVADFPVFEQLDMLANTTPAGMTASRLNRFRAASNGSLWGVAAAAVLLLALGVGSIAWVRARGEVHLVPALVPVSTPRAVREDDNSIELRVTVFPRTARVLLDGQPLAENPYLGQKPRNSTESHEISASAPGHITASRQLVFDRAKEVVLFLEAAPASGSTAPTETRPKAAARPVQPAAAGTGSAASAAASASSPTSCDPPFVIDERGIKKFKAACIQ